MQVTDAMVAKAAEAMKRQRRNEIETGLCRATYEDMAKLALTAALAEMWRPRSLAPHDSTVLVCVEPTEHNSLWNNQERAVYPAYIDKDGCVCDPSTWEPDSNLDGHMWRTTHFMPLPAPPKTGGE